MRTRTIILGGTVTARNNWSQKSPVYSFSFGATRGFLIKQKIADYKLELDMPNNSLIVMGGDTQQFFKHSVPKLGKREEKNKPKMVGRRINVTFRFFVE